MKRIQEENRVALEPLLPLKTPFVINVDPSSACNFKCKFCYHSNNKKMSKQGMMRWETYAKVIHDLTEFDAPLKTLRLYAFGEPLLNPYFAHMVKYAKEIGISETIDTTTNGSLLNPELNLRIIEAGLDRINISVEGINAKHYKKFSDYELDFKKYVDNITHLYENKKQCTIFIKINGDIISESERQEFVEIFYPISDGIAIENVMNCWYDFEMKDIEVNKEVGVYGQPLTHVDVCPYIFYSFCIQFDGEVSTCFLDWNRKLTIGDIHETSVKDLWNEMEMTWMRRTMLKKLRTTLSICKSCNQLEAGQPENLDEYAENLLKRYEGNIK